MKPDRTEIDNAIRALFCAYHKFTENENNTEHLTESDWDLWGFATNHRAVQERLDDSRPETKDGE